MLSVKFSEIPVYLQCSEFYQSLSSDDESSAIEIPAECFAMTDRVENLQQLLILLRVIQFWGVGDLPTSVLEYCYMNSYSTWGFAAAEALSVECKVLADLRFLFGASKSAIAQAITLDLKDLVYKLIQLCNHVGRVDSESTIVAVKMGRLSYLQLLHENNFPWGETVCEEAALGGHLDCLKYAHTNGSPLSTAVYRSAARGGHLACMEYCQSEGVEWDATVHTTAAEFGHLDCLDYAFLNFIAWTADVTARAASNGHLDCLEFALNHSCPVHHEALVNACRNGHLDCLRLLHTFHAKLTVNATITSAYNGHLDCLVYLHTHDCQWWEVTTDAAAEHGHHHCLQYAVEHGCPLGENAVQLAARFGSLPCLRYLVKERGQPISMDAYGDAFVRAHVECVRYIIDRAGSVRHYSYDFQQSLNMRFALCTSCYTRPEFDVRFLECIKYAAEHGWQWEKTIVDTAFNNNLEKCQSFMRQEGWVKLSL